MRILRFAWLSLLLWLGVLLLLGSPPLLHAQDETATTQVFVLPPVATQDHGSTLGVSVPFQLRNNEGDSINDARITNLQLRLIDMPAGAIDSFSAGTSQRIETPLYVSLLIDTSGSMGPYIDAVRTAARNAVNGAPQNARFRIVSFRGRNGNDNPDIDIRQDFTTDRARVLNAIDNIANPEGATCYYDTVYESLNALDNLESDAGSSARKAVVAFTDGDDIISANDTRPCSRHTIDEVIQEARRADIPVYTIGMYGNNPANIKEEDLRRLASDTRGVAAIGGQNEIEDLFKQVFSGLVNQYVAVFEVLAKPERNEAILEIQLSGVSEPIKAVFDFDSAKNYIPAPTPVPTSTPPPPPTPVPAATPQPFTEVILDAPRPDTASGAYTFRVSISNPRIVEALYLEVLAGNVSELIQEAPIHGGDKPEVTFAVDVSSLKPDREYMVQIHGVDTSGNRLLKPPRNIGSSDAPDPILAERKFELAAEKATPLEVKIRSLKPDYNSGQLLVELIINQPDTVDDYQAFINNEAGAKVVDTLPQVYPRGKTEVQVTMPPAALEPSDNPQPQKFKLFLSLSTAQDERADAEPFEFELVPPAKPGLFEQVTAGLEQNPMLAIGIVVVLSSMVLWAIFGRRPKKQAFSLPRPVEEYTIVAGALPGDNKKRGKLLIEVVETPSPADLVKRTYNRFPCIIGRSKECDVRLTGDSQLTRQHARLAVENSRIILTDLGSNNGTFVEGERLAPNTPVTLSDAQVFQLGRHTKIRVSLQY